MVAVQPDPIEQLLALVQIDRHAGLTGLRALADTGDREAVCHLALYLSETTPTTAEAIDWLERTAALGYAPAAWNLAMVAHEHLDSGAVRRWVDKAVELGSGDAITVQSNDYDVKAVLASWRTDAEPSSGSMA